jgi:hypothetical protein
LTDGSAASGMAALMHGDGGFTGQPRLDAAAGAPGRDVIIA